MVVGVNMEVRIMLVEVLLTVVMGGDDEGGGGDGSVGSESI